MSKARIIKLVENVHMGLGHDGLRKLLKKAHVDLDNIEASDLVMCLNTAGDKLKVIGCKGLVLGYLKMPNKQRIMKDALQFIPRTFGSGGFNYDKACEEALMTRLLVKRHPKGPLVEARAAKHAGL